MNDLIKVHHEDEDIQQLNLCTDLQKWKSEVVYIEMENQFYKRLFSSILIDKTEINKQDIKFISRQLENLDIKNQEFSHKLRGFLNEIDGIRECDDIQCETYFLNSHQKFKVEIENYFFQNRNLKTQIYYYINEGIKKFL